MSLHRISVEVTLTEMNCGECGGTYAINERYRKQKYAHGNSGWHCPYCQTTWGYFGDSENDRLQKEKDKLERRLTLEQNRRESAERETKKANNKLRAEKAAKTKLKNRIKHGVCPCCTRTFKNLARHMKGQHPEYVEKKK